VSILCPAATLLIDGADRVEVTLPVLANRSGSDSSDVVDSLADSFTTIRARWISLFSGAPPSFVSLSLVFGADIDCPTKLTKRELEPVVGGVDMADVRSYG
jgi:hypothetical protein